MMNNGSRSSNCSSKKNILFCTFVENCVHKDSLCVAYTVGIHWQLNNISH